MEENTNKKIYFASDIHLGSYPFDQSAIRERLFIQWLDEIKTDAEAIYLVGDIFDFWYEYKEVVPRGFVRFLGKLAELTDNGIPVHFFIGNHDIWVKDYLVREIGVILHTEPFQTQLKGRNFYIAHGDGLGPGDYSYKILRKIFTNSWMQFLFSKIHPNIALGFGHRWSRQSRHSKGYKEKFFGVEKEYLVLYARDIIASKPIDFAVFGHRHIPMEIQIQDSKMINLGEWLYSCTYGVFDGEKLELRSFRKDFDSSNIIRERML